MPVAPGTSSCLAIFVSSVTLMSLSVPSSTTSCAAALARRRRVCRGGRGCSRTVGGLGALQVGGSLTPVAAFAAFTAVAAVLPVVSVNGGGAAAASASRLSVHARPVLARLAIVFHSTSNPSPSAADTGSGGLA